jgi:hypothetical protein
MINPADVAVFTCPSCGAPLQGVKDGTTTTCAFCGETSTVHTGAAAELTARQARADAEALLARLGRPPSWPQQVAIALSSPWAVWLGFPLAAALFFQLGAWPMKWFGPSWEASHHERFLHVISPLTSWPIEVAGPTLGLLVLLAWGLFGARVDARRELQAALASRPPARRGGPTTCRHCAAPLTLAAEALAVRCESCGADNLVRLPERWIARAKKTTAHLRLTVKEANAKDAEGRRRLGVAALKRVPVMLGVLALASWPAFSRSSRAGWSSFRIAPGERVGAYRVLHREKGELPTSRLEGLAHCGLVPGKHPVRLDATDWCVNGRCTLVMLVGLSHGETLRLDWVAPASEVDAELRLAPLDYLGGTGVLADWFGDEVAKGALSPGEPLVPAFSGRVEVSGFYKVLVRGPPDASVQPCVVAP